MRKYLFRGKRKDNKEWVYGDLLQTEKDFKKVMQIVDWSKQPVTHEVDAESVGQLVKECDGVKYFEGDIAWVKDESRTVMILTWIDEYGLFGWLIPEEYEQNKAGNLDFDKVLFWTYAFSDDTAKDIELIGNTTDGPELLK